MVYPSANAHVADEPGMLAPALCEMNNFISIKSGSFEAANAENNNNVEKVELTKKETSASAVGNATVNEMNPFRQKTLVAPPTFTCMVIDDKRSDTEEDREDSKNMEYQSEDFLFQPKMEITLDQYRTVTPNSSNGTLSKGRSNNNKSAYKYPQVPLTFTQRKSTSDALFSFSRQVPKLTDECALVLTEARRNDEWDLAVAELMTQVLVVLHCSDKGDYGLEGLRRYLLTVGIVC